MTDGAPWTVTYSDTDDGNRLMELGAQSLEHAQQLASRISQLHGSATVTGPEFAECWINGRIWLGQTES